MVLIMPPVVTFLTRLLYVSAMYILPEESNAIPWGLSSPALVAGPPSPQKFPLPLPANVLIMPVETVSLRTR